VAYGENHWRYSYFFILLAHVVYVSKIFLVVIRKMFMIRNCLWSL